jgi:hypothetical protein
MQPFGLAAIVLVVLAVIGCSSSGVDVSPLITQTAADKAAKAPEQRKPSKVRSLDELLLFQPTKYPKGDWEPARLNFADAGIARLRSQKQSSFTATATEETLPAAHQRCSFCRRRWASRS